MEWVAADLTVWEPGRKFDLVTTHYAHPTMAQLSFYSRISRWVAPGGALLVVGHQHTARATGQGLRPSREHAEYHFAEEVAVPLRASRQFSTSPDGRSPPRTSPSERSLTARAASCLSMTLWCGLLDAPSQLFGDPTSAACNPESCSRSAPALSAKARHSRLDHRLEQTLAAPRLRAKRTLVTTDGPAARGTVPSCQVTTKARRRNERWPNS